MYALMIYKFTITSESFTAHITACTGIYHYVNVSDLICNSF